MIEMPFEIEFILTLTNRCNFKCNMCTQTDDLLPQEEMTIEDYKKFFDEISEINPKPKILLFGGEPLLYPHFDELLDMVYAYGFSCQLVTNGYYLDKHLEKLSKYNIGITISLDGTGDVHNNIRNNPKAFEKAKNAMDKIKELQKNGSKMNLLTNFVMLPDNIHNIKEFHYFMGEYDTFRLTIQHLQFSNPELTKKTSEIWQKYLGEGFYTEFIPRKKYEFDKDYINELYDTIEDVKNEFGRKVSGFVFPFLEKDEMQKYYLEEDLDSIRPSLTCTKPWFNPSINPNGDIYSCIGYKLGNIKEHSFMDIWSGERADKLRNTLIELKRFPICSKCCCFYKNNFLVVDDGYVELNNKKLIFPSTLNYVQSASKVAIILDSEQEADLNKEELPVLTIPVHSDKQLQEISKEFKVLAILK